MIFRISSILQNEKPVPPSDAAVPERRIAGTPTA
jgi:hypothetical protein